MGNGNQYFDRQRLATWRASLRRGMPVKHIHGHVHGEVEMRGVTANGTPGIWVLWSDDSRTFIADVGLLPA